MCFLKLPSVWYGRWKYICLIATKYLQSAWKSRISMAHVTLRFRGSQLRKARGGLNHVEAKNR